jgi:hypothetical protein
MTALSDGLNPVGPPGQSPQILLAFLAEIESLIPVTSKPRQKQIQLANRQVTGSVR